MEYKQSIWEIEKTFRFEAAHALPLHDGACRRLHGHSWVGAVVIRGVELVRDGAKSGMLIDFTDIKTALQPVIDTYLDHQFLNETTQLKNPTSEELARWMYRKLSCILTGIYCIRIEETCTSACRYYPNGI